MIETAFGLGGWWEAEQAPDGDAGAPYYAFPFSSGVEWAISDTAYFCASTSSFSSAPTRGRCWPLLYSWWADH